MGSALLRQHRQHSSRDEHVLSLARGRATQLKLFGAGSPLRLPKTYAFTAAVILNENNAGSFQRLAKRCLIRERNWDLPVNHFCSPDRRYPDF
jgi:hypothetical protein